LIQEEITVDVLLLICLYYILGNVRKNVLGLKNKLINIIKENSNKNANKTFNIDNFSKQFIEIHKNMELENSKILTNILNKTLKYFYNIEDLDIYLRSYLNLREVLKNIKNENFEYKNLLKKQFFDFISPLLDDKFKIINDSLETENWGAAFTENSEKNSLVLQRLQNKIDIMFFKNFDEYKKIINVEVLNNIISSQNSNISAIYFKDNKLESKNSINLEENIINEITKKDSNEETTTNNPIEKTNNQNQANLEVKNTIEIKESKYKIMNSTISLINSIFDTYKLLLICEESLMPHTCDAICSQIHKFLEYNREMVLDGEGVRKGKLKAIYQKEISIVCSNALIVKKFVGLFSSNQLLNPIFSEVNQSIDSILKTCRVKIKELFQLM